MKLNKTSISAALVAASRKISALLPRQTAVGGDEIDAVRDRCRRSYNRWGHCECPYPVGDIRRAVWVEESAKIARENLAEVMRDFQIIEKDVVNELIGVAKNV